MLAAAQQPTTTPPKTPLDGQSKLKPRLPKRVPTSSGVLTAVSWPKAYSRQPTLHWHNIPSPLEA